MDEVERQAAPLLAKGQRPLTPAVPPLDGEQEKNGKAKVWRRRPVIVVGTVLLGAALFLGLRYLAESWTHESTDDAFLDVTYVSIAPKVAGRVEKVLVSHNQKVQAGDALVELDGRDFQVALDQKKAAVAAAQANAEVIKSDIELFRTEVSTAETTARQSAAEAVASGATAERARADLKRAEELIGNHTISPQEFDTAKATAAAEEANLNAAQEKAASDQSKIAQAQAQLQAGLKSYERAQAQVRQAEWDQKAAALNLSYTHVTAPEAGYVTRKSVAAGDYVQAGQKLMALVPASGVYVTANFKETQLKQIRPGQPARIEIDSAGGGPFAGHVDSIQAGSGAAFSLLPPENAVGNYVKVVQRVPVKIVFDNPVEAGHVLGPGMSAVPSVRVKDWVTPEGVLAVVAAVLALGVGVMWWRAAGREALKRNG